MRTNFVKYHIIIKTKIFETMYVPIFLTLNYFIKFLYKFSSIYSHFLCLSLSVSAWTPSDPHAQQSCSGPQPGPRLAYMPSCPALGLSLDPVWAHMPSQRSCSGPQPGPCLGTYAQPAVLLWGSAWTLSGIHAQQSCSGPQPGPCLGTYAQPVVLLWGSA